MKYLIFTLIMMCHYESLRAQCHLFELVEDTSISEYSLEIEKLSKYLIEQKKQLEPSSFASIKGRKCVDDSFSLLMSKLSSLSSEPKRREQIQISQLLKLFSDVAQNLWEDAGYDFEESSIESVFSSLGKLKSTGKMIPHSYFCEWLGDSKSVSVYRQFLVSMMTNYVERIPAKQVYDLKYCVANTVDHKQALFDVLSLGVMKGAYDYSSISFKKRVYENQAVLASLNKKLKDLDPDSGAYKFTLRKINYYEKRIKKIFAGPRDLSSFVNRWVSSFGFEDQPYARRAIEGVSDSMKKSYPHGHLNFQNGDIFLEITSYGFGNLFHQLAGVSDFATHSGLILKSEEGGYPFYFSMDYGGKMKVKSLDEIGGARVYLRNKIKLDKDFALTVLNNFEKLNNLHFDSLFHEGILDEKGNGELYCSEFIHYAFKNRLDTSGELADMPSPFDSLNTRVKIDSNFAQTNFEKMGMDLQSNFYIPDTLIYSRSIEYLGHYFNGVWGGYTKPNSIIVADANRSFFKVVKEFFYNSHFKNTSFKYWVRFQLYKNKTEVNRVTNKLGKGSVITSRQYIDNYYIFRFAEIASMYTESILELNRKYPNEDEWQEAFDLSLTKSIIPKLEAIFKFKKAKN